ncbi:MAG: 50S ribosomal protein L29 [Microgenomates group bacterium]
MKKAVREYKTKTLLELEKEAHRLREEIAKLKLESKINPPKDTNLLMKKRKTLAVILTLITEKKQMEEIKKLKN